MKTNCFKWAVLLGMSIAFVACEEENEPQSTNPVDMTEGLYVVNEGNWGSGNATLTYYNPQTKEVHNESFYLANGMKLGDVAQSMCAADGKLWVVVNNSNVIYALDPTTLKELGRIEEGLVSPRYVCEVAQGKLYVSQMYSNKIAVVDTKNYLVTDYIECPNMEASTGSTEMMVSDGSYAYVSCWSYQKSLLKIEIAKDEVVGSVEVGVQPSSLCMDKNGKLWTLTDGGYQGNPVGYEAPSIVRVDAKTMTIEKRYTFVLGDYVCDLCLNGGADTLYWLNGDVWRMPIESETLPEEQFVDMPGAYYYGLTVAPKSSDVYVADAIDYVQQGKVYRFNSKGESEDDFSVGICPGAFCWK